MNMFSINGLESKAKCYDAGTTWQEGNLRRPLDNAPAGPCHRGARRASTGREREVTVTAHLQCSLQGPSWVFPDCSGGVIWIKSLSNEKPSKYTSINSIKNKRENRSKTVLNLCLQRIRFHTGLGSTGDRWFKLTRFNQSNSLRIFWGHTMLCAQSQGGRRSRGGIWREGKNKKEQEKSKKPFPSINGPLCWGDKTCWQETEDSSSQSINNAG